MSTAILELAKAVNARQPAVFAVVVDVKGASPAKVGAQITCLSDGRTVGTVGGGKLEAAVLSDAKKALEQKKPGLFHYVLAEEGEEAVGTLCGGEISVYVQPYLPAPQLVIVGGGHIGRPLKVMGEAAGFEVIVVDVAAGLATVPELEQVALHEDSYVVLITTDHVSDEAALRVALKSPAPYIGMIGSLSKCKTIREHLLADGFSAEELERRVYAPIGLDLGGSSPQEIAVAILAEVIAVRHHAQAAAQGVRLRRI